MFAYVLCVCLSVISLSHIVDFVLVLRIQITIQLYMTKKEYITLLQPIKIQVKKQHTALKKKRIFRQINEWKK